MPQLESKSVISGGGVEITDGVESREVGVENGGILNAKVVVGVGVGSFCYVVNRMGGQSREK